MNVGTRPLRDERVVRFEQVILPHLGAAYNLARWLTRSAHDADDVVQEAYLRAYQFFDGFHGGDGRAWLLRIVRNTCYTWLEKNRGAPAGGRFDETKHSPGRPDAAPDAPLVAGEDRELLRQALAELPDEFREAIVLRELEGLSYKEIAAVTGAPSGRSCPAWPGHASGCKRDWPGAGPRALDVTCDETRDLLSPHADGELDLVRTPGDRTAPDRLPRLRRRPGAPAALRRQPPRPGRVLQAAGRPGPALRAALVRPSFPWRRLAMAAAAALLLTAALWGTVRAVTTPSAEELLAQEVVAGHVRSLMAEHLLDVKSSNQHTVKPWFLGRVDVAPEVKDLKEEHFPLVGGRLDYIDGRPAAALVYKRNDHVINVFVWREAGRDRPPVFLDQPGLSPGPLGRQ